MQTFHDFLLIFVPLFVVVNPAGSVPIYLALTADYSEEQRRSIAARATIVAASTGIIFIVLGQAIFNFLGVAFEDFQIAGGILLVVLAIIDLLIPGKPADNPALSADRSRSIGVVPLGVPLIVGPATLTASLLLVNTFSKIYNERYTPPFGQIIVVLLVSTALLINLLLVYFAMRYSKYLVKLVGRNTMAVMNKIVMILLAAIAVSLIRQGVVGIIQGMHKT